MSGMVGDSVIAAMVGAGAALAGAALNGLISYWNGERQRRYAARQGWAEKMLQYRVSAISEAMLSIEKVRYAAFELSWDYKQRPESSQDRTVLRATYNAAITALNVAIHSQRVFLPPSSFDELQALHIKHGDLLNGRSGHAYWSEVHSSWARFAETFEIAAAEHLRFREMDEPLSSDGKRRLRSILDRFRRARPSTAK